eukprot:scaffold6691_cov358-Prasinococcus_capsulatus_cf.AAC.28
MRPALAPLIIYTWVCCIQTAMTVKPRVDLNMDLPVGRSLTTSSLEVIDGRALGEDPRAL